MTVVGRPLPVGRAPVLRELPPTRRTAPGPKPNATLAARREVTATLGVFTIVADLPLGEFRPGQYASFGVWAADELIQRPYSIVELDSGRTGIELFIRRLPDGRLSNLLWAAPPGERLHVGPVKGLFTLDEADPRPRIMVGTGTGLAPLLAMLGDLAARADRTPSVLIHGASFHAELAFGERVDGWRDGGLPVDYRPTVSRPNETRNAGWLGRTGRAETQLAALLAESPSLAAGGSVAYLCGNPDMISACSTVLRAASFAPRDIRVEHFHPPTS